jgi:hypothetical protein
MNVAALRAATVPATMTAHGVDIGLQLFVHGRDRDLLALRQDDPTLAPFAPAYLARLDPVV